MARGRTGGIVSSVLAVTVVASVGVHVGALGSTGPAPGGFVEPATSTEWRAPLSEAEAEAMLPERGAFRFPDPYLTQGFRLTNAGDCSGGRDCVNPVGYSYWSNINNHSGSDTMLVFAGLDRRRGGDGPTLFSIDKRTRETHKLGPLFPATHPLSWASGEGWYFSRTRPYTLYVNDGRRLFRYDVRTRTLALVFDLIGRFDYSRYLWQLNSSSDDRVHSATVRVRDSYEALGCLLYREDTRTFQFVAKKGAFDECQIDKSGRWLVIKEDVDGRHAEDNRIIDVETGSERVLLDENGAGGHSDLGYGYMVAADNHHLEPGAVRSWRFDRDLDGGQPVASVPGQGTLVYQFPWWGASVGHVSHANARRSLPIERQRVCSSSAGRLPVPRLNEIVCYRLDGSLRTLVVAPNLSDLDASGGGQSDYDKLPKGNLDPTGEYFTWSANAGTGRLDVFVVRVPWGPLDGSRGWEPVEWIDRVNATSIGSDLEKTSGCQGCPDAGAASEQQIGSAGGALQFTADELSGARYVGLSDRHAGTRPDEIVFSIRLQSGIAAVREAGVYRKDVRFEAGDLFEIRVDDGVVRYVKNGAAFYTSASTPRYPLVADTSLLSLGAVVTDARIRSGP